MKTLEEIIKQDPVFLNDWSDINDLARDFAQDAITQEHILFASYSYQNYDGDAYVLSERDGQLYEVYGGHCSCYGLEGQWDTQLITPEALLFRFNNGNWSSYSSWHYMDNLKKFLGI